MLKSIKSLMVRLATFFIAFLFVINLSAMHLVGGEITYKCLGNDQYEITLLVYRDCLSTTSLDGAPGGVQGGMTIYLGASETPFKIIGLNNPNIEKIDPNTGDPCLGLPKSNLCLERGRYQATVILPKSDKSYYIVYQRCCRNNTITNIVDPGGTGTTYYTEIKTEAQNTCNSSPTFNNFPQALICVNEPLIFDHAATDIDSDSLVYELCSPLNGGGQGGGNGGGFDSPNPNPDKYPPYENIDFLTPFYEINSPLGANAQVKIDPSTGLLTGFPKVSGQFVVGICVKEFRNGMLLGKTFRDFQFNVTICDPVVVAVLEGQKVNSIYEYVNCGDLSFTIKNLSDETFVDKYQAKIFQPGAIVQVNDNNDIFLTFSDYGDYNGFIVLNPSDMCTDTAFFHVKAVDIQAGFQSEVNCDGSPVNFLNISQSEFGISTYDWSFGDGDKSQLSTPSHQYEKAGNYIVMLTIKDNFGCSIIYEDTIQYYPISIDAKLDPSEVNKCIPFIYQAKVKTSNYSSNTYIYYIDQREIAGDSLINYLIDKAGQYDLRMVMTTPSGCSVDTTFEKIVTAYSLPIPEMVTKHDFLTNENKIISFEDKSKSAKSRNWQLNGQFISSQITDNYELPDTGYHQLLLTVLDENGCMDSITKTFFVEPIVRYSLPNVFAPEGEEINANFFLFGNEYVHKINKLEIYDRSGSKVFTTQNVLPQSAESKWDGTFNGQKLPSGVYVFLAEITLYNKEIKLLKGDITLIR